MTTTTKNDIDPESREADGSTTSPDGTATADGSTGGDSPTATAPAPAKVSPARPRGSASFAGGAPPTSASPVIQVPPPAELPSYEAPVFTVTTVETGGASRPAGPPPAQRAATVDLPGTAPKAPKAPKAREMPPAPADAARDGASRRPAAADQAAAATAVPAEDLAPETPEPAEDVAPEAPAAAAATEPADEATEERMDEATGEAADDLAADEPGEAGASSVDAAAEAEPGEPAARRRRRRGRGRRAGDLQDEAITAETVAAGYGGEPPATARPAEPAPAAEEAPAVAPDDDEAQGSGSARTRARRRRRAAARARARGVGEPDDLDATDTAATATEAAGETAGPSEALVPEPAPAGRRAGRAADATRQQAAQPAARRAPETPSGAPAPAGPATTEPAPAAPGRGRRLGRRGAAAASNGTIPAPAAPAVAASEAAPAPAPRGRGRRGERARQSANANQQAAGVAALSTAAGTAETRERKADNGNGANGSAGAATAQRSTRLSGRGPGRGGRRRRVGLTEEQKRQIREDGPEKRMLVTEGHDRTQIAVIEGQTLVEHYVTRKSGRSQVGNIYLGRVQNVLPGMEAAFVDIGKGRNAVLYAGEVTYNEEDLEGEAPRIERALKPGQPVLVQVTKDPIGSKGARLTTEISLAGRYLVLQPSGNTFGISRRLPEEERNRLREILKEVRPKGLGVIVRTAAEGASAEDLRADLARLQTRSEQIDRKRAKVTAPALVYAEPELVVRVIRDIFSPDFVELVVDSPELHDRVQEYLTEVAPDLLPKLKRHDAKLPLFEQHRVTEQIHKALDRKVWLPSGGSIVIDKTEAMTVVDVNTGKFVGKTSSSLEETVVANNLEAADEIVRQLRLRDIGGIIIIDFIDMLFEHNQQKVLDRLRAALARDKTKSQVMEISSLGLVQMTRKRISGGLLESFSEPCPTCEGRGIVITHEMA